MEQEENSAHWSQQNEQAAGYWQLKFLLVLFKILPVLVLRIIAFPVGFFYFFFSKRGRTESRRFLQNAAAFIEDPKTAKKCRSPFGALRHIISFSLSLIEKIQSWAGRYSFKNIHFQDDDVSDLIGRLEEGKGAFLLCSHLGNTEFLRGLLNFGRTGVSRNVHITAIMDKKVTAYFTRMLKELNPQSDMDIVGAEEIGPETAVIIEERLASGGLVAIAGDRTAAGTGKNIMIPFLGKEAPFPSGAFYLVSMMHAPVYFVFGLRRGDLSVMPEYDMYVHKSHVPPASTRKEKIEGASLLARSYAALLESYCKKQPFQWYNFFDFWQEEK